MHSLVARKAALCINWREYMAVGVGCPRKVKANMPAQRRKPTDR